MLEDLKNRNYFLKHDTILSLKDKHIYLLGFIQYHDNVLVPYVFIYYYFY